MKTLILFGSPRKTGNTAALLAPFTEELENGGAEIRYTDVYEKKIEGCRACLGCQNDSSRISCVIQDDMQEILQAASDAELIVLAAPVYAWSFPAPMKAVIDRLIYASCKYYGNDPQGPALLEGRRLALLMTCGYPVEKGADLCEEAMKRYCRHCRLRYAGMLCERQRNLKEAFMDEEKERHAREFARELLRQPLC